MINSINNFNNSCLPSAALEGFQSRSPATKINQVHRIGIKRLLIQDQLQSEKVFALLGLSVKILLAPITLLAYLIFKYLSKIASSFGLGNEAQVRHVDQQKRVQLLGLGGKEVLFGFNKKSVLEGMYFQSDLSSPNTKTILLCTGSHFSYEKYAIPMVKALKSMGHNVMVFNYEGFGNSEGVRSEQSIYKSVEAAYQYLKQEKGCLDENIVGWGYSLGSGAVTELASKHKVDVVIDRGFSSMSEVAHLVAPYGLKTIARIIFFVGAHFDNFSKLKRAKGNVLIAQGIQDTTMKEELHGKFLQEAINNKKRIIFRKVNSAHHHSDQVWFEFGEDRAVVEQFLNKK